LVFSARGSLRAIQTRFELASVDGKYHFEYIRHLQMENITWVKELFFISKLFIESLESVADLINVGTFSHKCRQHNVMNEMF